MICAVFYNSGFKRTLCGSKWDSLTDSSNAFNNLGTGSDASTARYGCCPANKYMSSPEGTGTFVEADSCSACPAGTMISSLTSVPNDEISCELCPRGKSSNAGSTSCDLTTVKMPDGCKGKAYTDRSCDPRKAVDNMDATGSGTHATYGPMKDWDMSEVTDISYLFYGKGTMNADLSSWDVSRVTTMQGST